jgi:RNA polymerase sigma factor (sigma-70 family)
MTPRLDLSQARTRGGTRPRIDPSKFNPPDVVNRIASENIALVHHIARQFRSRTIEHEDLVGEGMLGLIEGAQRFDASKGSKVGTYLGFWIRARIFRAMQADAGATNEHERKVVFNITRPCASSKALGWRPRRRTSRGRSASPSSG